MELRIIDKVKDCPPCPYLELRFDYETGMSVGRDWERQTWVARCIHERACGRKMWSQRGKNDG